jgi:uncharacterized protein DUF4190
MKRCPTCNQEFTDEWLTFCTQDGTSLVVVQTSSHEPPPTLAMPPSVSPLEQPTMDMPGAGFLAPTARYTPPQTSQPGWQPPPPPPRPVSTQNTLALASMVLGIVSITIGWCCYFGVITGPVALGLGIYALSQIKKDPKQFGGRGMAIAGIVMGSLYFVFLALIILIYGLSFLISGLN